MLKGYDSRTAVNKKDASMKDLSALTAVTGDEFAMFTKGQERLIIRGDKEHVSVNETMASELNAQGYKWSGHTHPGIEKGFTLPSDGDVLILKQFKQETSVIYNSKGQYSTFGKY